jgi:hypothetical protein
MTKNWLKDEKYWIQFVSRNICAASLFHRPHVGQTTSQPQQFQSIRTRSSLPHISTRIFVARPLETVVIIHTTEELNQKVL